MTCKPYDIPKTLIWEAWLHVKSQPGSRGDRCRDDRAVREQAGRQPVQTLESDELRQLFSAAGEGRADPEEVRRRPDIGHPDGSRQNRADGGQDVAGATA